MRTSLLLLAFVSANLASAQTVTPSTSLIDVPARRAFLAQTKSPLILAAIQQLPSCVALEEIPAPPAPFAIPHHYLNGSNGPVNPEEPIATRPFNKFETRITAGMNRWLATGSEAEAKCALDQMDKWAAARALINYDPIASSQAWFQAEWTLCATGVTASVLAEDAKLDPAEQHRVAAWLDEAATRLISIEGTRKSQKNNHHDWRGLAAISIGSLNNDRKLIDFGVTTFKEAIDQLNPDGSMPLEMARHENAIHYQGFALQPLVLIAEFAAQRHIDLYSYSAHGLTLHDAIVFYGRAIADPSIIQKWTTDKQGVTSGRDDFDPIVFYIARFGPESLPQSLVEGIKPNTETTRLGGNAVVLAAR